MPQKRKYRSFFEEQVIDSLEKNNVKFSYESQRIPYQKSAHYLPDIELSGNLFVEIKGRFTSEDRKKHLLVKQQNPDIEIRFVFQRKNNKISKNSKTSYADWCKKYGFKYAEKEVPKAWIEELNSRRSKELAMNG